MTASPTEHVEAYLCALAGGAPESSFIERRHRVAEHTLASLFFPLRERKGLVSAIRSHAPATDVYVGCAPRVRRSGSKRDVEQVWMLWAECDGITAARAAHAYRPAPSIVIASGSGPNLHAYWPLRQPLTAPEAEVANLRLAHALNADRVCYDAARILRPPGTWNHKHSPPTPVAALRVDLSLAFDAPVVLANAPKVHQEPIARRWVERADRNTSGDPLLGIPPAVYVGELLGARARPGRKVHCPFHADERPSLHVYPTASRGWSCFSCGRGGSVYDLAAALWGLETRGREFKQLRHRLQERLAPEIDARTPGLER